MREHIEWPADESLAYVLRIKNMPGTEMRVAKHYGTQYLREVMGGTYSVIDVTRKGDL
jgi:hypothetical protein